MSEQEEDFAALFEASVKARRFERGQTVEGIIVGFGPKEAFVDVGGKAEAVVDLAELKDADGDVEVSVGDRIQAIVVSTGGGIVLSRRGVRNAATQRELEDAYRVGARRGRQGGEGREGRLRGADRPRARVLSVLADRHRPHRGSVGARAAGLHVPDHRVQGGRDETSSSRGASTSRSSSAPAPTTCASRSCRARCSPAASCRFPTSAPSWTSAAASRGCCTCPKWAGRGSPAPARSSRRAIRSR